MKLLAGLGLAGVSACGFSPVYAPVGPASRLYGRTALPEPNSEESYQLIRELEGRLGRASSPDFALDLALRLSESRLAVTVENTATRIRVSGRLTYTLRDAMDRELAKGEVTNFTGYSATGSTVATQAAKADARARLVVILSDLLITRLVAEMPPVPSART
ncbi:LptE family protein [Oceanicola sp. S124]|uniref:LptE family protein n=1 Tax=Oceanicola sp. S124 TaxID=1042378 RepID=UPI00025596CA|nr:LptE family protein [Oceanicola sp. S124]